MAIELGGAPIVSALLNQLVPMVSKEVHRFRGVKDELTQLKKTLEAIQGVLADAEKQQVNNTNIQLWLRDLREIAYEAEDILDKYAYKSLRDEIETRKRDKLKKFFSPSSNFVAFRIKIGHELTDLNEKLVQINDRRIKFNLSTGTANLENPVNTDGQSRRETVADVDPSDIVGRERAASDLKDLLFSSNNEEISSSSVIRIVGIGGLGKTSLAQIVYNDEAVLNQFGVRIWVCISQNSDKKKVYAQLLEHFERKKTDLASLHTMVEILKEKLQSKRYLIVLDDMWNDQGNEWDDMLKTLLRMGSRGSRVIVTTRSNEVIASLGNSLSNYKLDGLSDEESWVLLEKNAFGSEGAPKPAHLIEIGRRIAKKCGGVPLAIKVLGGMMSKDMSEEMWGSIDNNEVWDQKEGEDKIINVLKLSYDYLEPHLKQCFTYCALFPKDHIIKRKALIQLWMAEGFLSSNKPNTEMELGDKYFNSLVRNSFLQDVTTNEVGFIHSCKMHDLVHDLVQFLSQNECLILSANQIPEDRLSGLRRISFLLPSNEYPALPRVASVKRKKMRAFLCTPPRFHYTPLAMGMIFKNFSHLRVLDLSCYMNKELISSIGDLKYLRYLNLSNSELTELPESITTLYHLQILNLKNCFKLQCLPRDITKMKEIRHLIICKSKTATDEWIPPMPRKVGKLIHLQYLPLFTVGKEDGFGIDELRKLNLLGGRLHIHDLENVKAKEEAERACIGEKKHIVSLDLSWRTSLRTALASSGAGDDILSGVLSMVICYEAGDKDLQVLQALQPHRNLKKLGIYNYAGPKFSTWMMDLNNLLPNLVTIVLENCNKCEKLPPLGLLPFLKVLRLEGFPALKKIDSGVSSFPCLEDLCMRHMGSLEEWSDRLSESSSSSSSFSSSFPVLKKLKVEFCPKLRITTARFPYLKELVYTHSNGEPIRSLVDSNLESLTSVQIENCDELVFLPQGLVRGKNILGNLAVLHCKNFKGFKQEEEDEREQVVSLPNNSLRDFSLVNCPGLLSWPDIGVFNSLRYLAIYACKSQKHIPGGIEYLPKLEHLTIGEFSEELDTFPFPAAHTEDGNLKGRYFPSLQTLCISGWPKLNCLPDQIQYLPAVECIGIGVFPSLEVLPDWLGNLASLKEFALMHLSNLKSLPSREQMLRLSLRALKIDGCPVIAERCKPGGEDYNKISSIPKVTIDGVES